MAMIIKHLQNKIQVDYHKKGFPDYIHKSVKHQGTTVNCGERFEPDLVYELERCNESGETWGLV